MRIGKNEFLHIFISILVLSVAVSGIGPDWQGTSTIARNLVSVSIPLVVGFFLHEMAHKIIAIRYGYRAHFQMWPQGLLLALLIGIASSGRMLFAAPGAVMIEGASMTQEEEGKISLVGPVTNLAVATAFYPLIYVGGIISYIGYFGAFINTWLALFNLLPFPPLDGSKIFRWRPEVGIGLLALVGTLLFFVL